LQKASQAGSDSSSSSSSSSSVQDQAPSVTSGNSAGSNGASAEEPGETQQKQQVLPDASNEGVLTTQAAAEPDPLTPAMVAGQKCVEDLFANLGATQAKCFSSNGFTAQALKDAVTGILGGTPPDMTTFQNNLQGLLSCLTSAQESSETPAPVSNSGGAEAPTANDEAAPATAVSGTPNFTG